MRIKHVSEDRAFAPRGESRTEDIDFLKSVADPDIDLRHVLDATIESTVGKTGCMGTPESDHKVSRAA